MDSEPPRDDVSPQYEVTLEHTSLPNEDAPSHAPRPGMPESIGPYKVLGVIGTGGMGAVYEAIQESPERRVALKVIKAGQINDAGLARFRFEAQVLGRLQHPNIAQIYEAGTHETPEGPVPFFAMEYVPGALPITVYAERHHLDLQTRVTLFMQVCDAVHHAHQKAVIHRDLKPDNILVTGQGRPKIIDFGVARAADSDLAIATMRTSIGQIIGTLQYMSPEQCAADPDNIDARTDVYALGVMLYELLAGSLPYDLRRQAIHDAIRTIQEQEPTRMGTISSLLRGDLENISLRALEKEPRRRYQSASDLRRDLERYLQDEPVEARPVSTAYRFRKFIRRNRKLSAAVAVIALLLVGGLLQTTVGLRILRRQHAQLVERNDSLKDAFVAHAAITGSMSGEIYDAIEKQDAALSVKELVSGVALEHARALRDRADTIDVLNDALPDARYQEARALVRKGDILGGSRGAFTNLGRPSDAVPLYEEADRIASALLASDSNRLAHAQLWLLVQYRLADATFLLGDHASALADFIAVREAGQALRGNWPNDEELGVRTAAAMRSVGTCHAKLDDAKAALEAFREAIGLQERGLVARPTNLRAMREVALTEREIAWQLGKLEHPEEAHTHHRRAVRFFDELSQRQPENGRAARDLAWARYFHANNLAYGLQESEQARRELTQGLALLQQQCVNNSRDADSSRDLVRFLDACIDLQPHLNDASFSIDACRSTLDVMRPVLERDPAAYALKDRIAAIRAQLSSLESAAP